MTVSPVAGQAVGVVIQIIIADAFGARADMDAFIAASTLPRAAGGLATVREKFSVRQSCECLLRALSGVTAGESA